MYEKPFYDKREISDQKTREKMLFENFSEKLKKITSFSEGWKRYSMILI